MPDIKWPNRIKEIREKKGMTQRDVSRASDIAETDISRLERGQAIPRVDRLQRLAMALGVKVDDLLIEPKKGKQRGGI